LDDEDLIKQAQDRANMKPIDRAMEQAAEIITFCQFKAYAPGETVAAMALAIQAIIENESEPGIYRKQLIATTCGIIKGE